MGLVLPHRRRTLQRQRQNTAFLGTAAGGGLYNFDKWDDEFPTDAFTLMLRAWFFASGAVATAELAFANPDDPTGADRMVILEDNTGTLESFVEDNLGQWWVVPHRTGKSRLYWDLQFITTGDVGDATLNVEIAWVPNWPCSIDDLRNLLAMGARCG